MGWIDFFRSREVFIDTTKFGDELANNISWKPLVRGGANFRTRKLQVISPSRVEFPGGGLGCFGIFFFLFGLLLSGGFTFIMWSHGSLKEFGFHSIVIPLVALIFCGAGVYIIRLGKRSIVFDKAIGYFWEGKKEYNSLTSSKMKQIARLDEIYSLQIIKERVRGNKRSYNSYELNLVFKNGNRHNVMDHADYNSLIVDSVVLAEFLQVPVWNSVK